MSSPPEVILAVPRKVLVKSASHDNIRGSPLSSSDEEVGGGVRLSMSSISLGSPSPSYQVHRNPSTSGITAQRPSSSPAFQVGNALDDDVFTESASVASAADDEDDTNDAAEEIDETHESYYEELDETQEADENVDTEQLRECHTPGDIDAQVIYPPSACVFVANLTQGYDDQRLEEEVTRHFSQYGSVFVKIRRDPRQMPFAFCQYTCDDDALDAGNRGKGTEIFGRPCRIEMAKANSCFIVFKKTPGQPITTEEAVGILIAYGDISRSERLSETMRQALKLPPSIVVYYKMWDAKRDVVKKFQSHKVYGVIEYDSKASSTDKYGSRFPTSSQHQLAQYDIDRRSAFFGNLPLSMTNEVLEKYASAVGSVVKTNVMRKVVASGVQICFGFVEFVRPDSADDAVTMFHNRPIDGHFLRVARKQSRTYETPNRAVSSAGHQSRRRASGVTGNTGLTYAPAYTSPTGRPARVYPVNSPRPAASSSAGASANDSGSNTTSETGASSPATAHAVGTPDNRRDAFTKERAPVSMTPAPTVAPMSAPTVADGHYAGPSNATTTMPPFIPHYSPYGYPTIAPYMAGPMTPSGVYGGYPPYYPPHLIPEMYSVYPMVGSYAGEASVANNSPMVRTPPAQGEAVEAVPPPATKEGEEE